MKNLTFAKTINKSVRRVWETMLQDRTYRIWTSEFNKYGSWFEGDWKEGSKIRFVGSDAEGKLGGLYGNVIENKKYQSIIIEYMGEIVDGKEIENVKWKGARECYTFTSISDEITILNINLDTEDEYENYMKESWKKTLTKLAYICEYPDMITVSIEVSANIEKVWEFWNDPAHIVNWNFAADTWECPSSTNDLRIGGEFHNMMAEKGSDINNFDFVGIYTDIVKYKRIEYNIFYPKDGRKVKVHFEKIDENSTKIIEIFEAENEYSLEQQQFGWEAILGNFKKYIENNN